MNIYPARYSGSLKRNYLIIALLVSFVPVWAQRTDSVSFYPAAVRRPAPEDSLMKRPPRPLWRPAAEMLLTQAIPFTFNYFTTDPNISRISFKTIGNNLNVKNWEFDDDKFLTNQFAHPYHGNLYFNAFRSNGYSFWQSVPGTLAGCMVWEIAGEINPVSYNDIINTSFGGIALGEMTYRVAGLIINQKRSGRGRVIREILATAINPVNGFNRLADGEWKRVSATDPDDSLHLDITIDGGARWVSKTANQLFSSSRTEPFASVRMRYGNPFRNYKRPFDNFYILLEVGNADSGKLSALWVQGSLWGKITGGGDKSLKALRLTMNYDFYKNSAFEYGGQSLLLTWMAHFTPGKNWTINTELGGGAILMSASFDKHRVYREARNYTYGSGLAIYTAGEVVFKDRLSYLILFRSGWTGTISGSSSSKALHLISAELRYRFFRNFSLSATWGNFRLVGFYPGYDTSDDVYPFLRCAAAYRLLL